MSDGGFTYKSYSLTVGPGEEAFLNVHGSYIACLDSDWDSFQVRLNEGSLESFFKGLKVRMAGGPLTKVGVFNPNGTNLTVELAVGNGDLQDSRFALVGSLDVRPEFPPFYTDDAKTFHGGTQALAVAAQYSHIQVLNPAASGVTCYLARLSLSVASGQISLGTLDAALTNLSSSPINKTLGGAAAACQLRYATDVAQLGGTFNVFEPQGVPYIFDFAIDPFVLAPGKGLVVRSNTVNVSLFAMFDWREI